MRSPQRARRSERYCYQRSAGKNLEAKIISMPFPTPKQRLLASFERKGQDECWPWTGHMDVGGYGFFWRGRRSRPHRTHAHRVLYQMRYGPIPPGLQACHHCDNRRCVNPRHIFLGTHKDNADDRERKGRGNHPKGKPNFKNRGSGNGNSRVTENDLVRIRAMLANGIKNCEVAREFKISPACVSLIKTGKCHQFA